MKKILIALLLIATCTASTVKSTVKAYKVTYNEVNYIKFVIDLNGNDFIIVNDRYYISKTLGDKVYYYSEVVKNGKIEYKLYSNNTVKSETLEVVE